MAATFKRNTTFSTAKPSVGGDKLPKVEDLVDVLKLSKKWQQGRAVGPTSSYGEHWIETKKKDGSTGSFPKPCLAYDPESEEIDSTKTCPYCEMPRGQKFSKFYLTNFIVRSLQEAQPSKMPRLTAEEKKTGFKDITSESWTPVRVLKTKSTLAGNLKEFSLLNKHVNPKTKKKQAYDISHPKYGRDISVQFDGSKKGTDMYAAQKEDVTPLSDEEKEYLLYNIEDLIVPEKLAVAKAEAAKALKNLPKGEEDEDSEDEDEDYDDEESPKKKKSSKKPVAKKGKKKAEEDEDSEDSDDEDDEDEDLDLDDEDEDESPKKKKKPVAKKGKKKDEDDEDSDDDDDDDDDEPPKKKSSKKSVAKKGKKKVEDSDDEDDEDSDDEDDDDSDDEDGDDSDDEDDDDSDDEDDDDSDDEDDDEELDLDDDDEEEAPKKKVVKKKRK